MGEQPLVVASNRGPVALVRDDEGNVVERRGVGGLVTAVGGALRGRDATWIAAAITEEDRARAASSRPVLTVDLGDGSDKHRGSSGAAERESGEGTRVRLVAIDPARYDAYYNEFSNRVLWFLHHYLWETPRAPAFGPEDEESWEAYRAVNAAFAGLMAEEAGHGAAALPQDYHLSLVAPALRKERPDLAIAQFWHIPFCQPDQLGVLPDAWARALLEGMLAGDLVGFQAERWAASFVACCRTVLGARARGRTIVHAGGETRVGVYPVGVDAAALAEQARAPEVARASARIEGIAGDRLLILRVDRTELSKNILRGFVAYEALLERHPELHGRVVHLALLTPSRPDVPEYREYTEACVARAGRINERFGTAEWQPVALDMEDDFPQTLAAYRRYDVLLVNPVYDGMNLVAREGPLLNERDGVLVLSRNAGAAAELGPAALVVNPFDPTGTASALSTAVSMPAEERRERAARLRALARGTSPARWLDRQLKDLPSRRG